MRHHLMLIIACVLLAGCGAATAHAANAPTSGKNSLTCAVRFNGVGLDFVKYHLTCAIHDSHLSDTGYSLTAQINTTRGSYIHGTWCQAALAHGSATCQQDFVIIVPIHATALTLTAHFLPSNASVQTQLAMPRS